MGNLSKVNDALEQEDSRILTDCHGNKILDLEGTRGIAERFVFFIRKKCEIVRINPAYFLCMLQINLFVLGVFLQWFLKPKLSPETCHAICTINGLFSIQDQHLEAKCKESICCAGRTLLAVTS